MASSTQWNEFEQTQGDSKGQRFLGCWSPWGHKESGTTFQLNNKKKSSHILTMFLIKIVCVYVCVYDEIIYEIYF